MVITIQGKKATRAFVSLEDAYLTGTERDLTEAIIVKLAHAIDQCDSSRDLRPLMNGIFEAIDRLHALEAADGVDEEKNDTPLATILKLAQ